MRKTGLILLLGLTISSCETPNVERKDTGYIYTEGGHSLEEMTIAVLAIVIGLVVVMSHLVGESIINALNK